MKLSRVLALVACLAANPPPSPGQTPGPDGAVCPTCAIGLSLDLTLGGPDPLDGLVCGSGPTSWAVDKYSNLYVAPSCDSFRFMVFDAEGGFRGEFGDRGQGPGEFEAVDLIFVDSDHRLNVIDASLRRVAYSLGPNGVVGEPEILPPFPGYARSVAAATEGRVVANMEYGGVHPLHVVSAEGQVEQSFGGEGGQAPSMYHSPLASFRSLAPSQGGRLWAAHVNRYRIELWDSATVERLSVISPEVKWFEPWDAIRPGELLGPRLASLHEDAAGLLWALFVVPNPDGPPPADAHQEESAMDPHGPEAWHKRYDSILQVLDPETGEIQASLFADLLFGRWVGGRLVALRETDSGDRSYELYRASFTNSAESDGRSRK